MNPVYGGRYRCIEADIKSKVPDKGGEKPGRKDFPGQ